MTRTDPLDAIIAEAMAATPAPTRARLPRSTGVCDHPGCPRNLYSKGLGVCTGHVQGKLGISYQVLARWARAGYVRPVPRGTGTGSGTPLDWPAAELEIARRIASLTAIGLPVEWAASFVRSGDKRREIAPGYFIELSEATT